MKSNIKIGYKNNYHFELIDAITGKIKQSADVHNICLNNFGSFFDHTPYVGNILHSLGLGSGTTTPQKSNTALDKYLWGVIGTDRSYAWVDDYTFRGTATFTFPATSAYVGTVTEAGLMATYQQRDSVQTQCMVTRALITDSEGQPISFNKTDLDILVVKVTVELSIVSGDDNFKIFPHCFLLRHILGEVYWGATTIMQSSNLYTASRKYGSLSLARFDYDLGHYSMINNGVSLDQVISPLTADAQYSSSLASSEASFIINTARLPATSVTSQRYYKAVVLGGLGYWELPNEEIFPTYNIKDISLGTGDGVTTSFVNPLSYFKKDTEKIYKNGILLEREVDYTINHKGNVQRLPEICQLTPPIKVSSSANKTGLPSSVASLIYPSSIMYNPHSFDASERAFAFNVNNPLYLEYEEEISFNYLHCTGYLRAYSSGGGYNEIPAGTPFYIDYSQNGEDYVELGAATTTATGGAFTIDFEKTSAKYWRIRTSIANNVMMYSSSGFLSMGLREPNVVFTEAPAEGDILTMDVDMDIIMKNANFVVDVSCRFDFSY